MALPLRARWGFIFKCKTTTKIRGCYVPIIDTFASIKTKTTRLALCMSYPILGPLIHIFVDEKDKVDIIDQVNHEYFAL